MSHNNYSKFFKNVENEEVVPVMEDQISIEEIGDNEPHVVSEELKEAVINAGGEVMGSEEPVTEVETVIGVVSGCEKLNLRQEASKDSEVLIVLNKDAELVISDEESTEDF